MFKGKRQSVKKIPPYNTRSLMSQPKICRLEDKMFLFFFPAQMIFSVHHLFLLRKSDIRFSSSFKSETSCSRFILFADPVCRCNHRLYNQARENYGTKGFHHYNGRFGKSSRPIKACPNDCDNKWFLKK